MTATQDTWPAGATATMNVTYTQANAGGGAVSCEIVPGSGNEFIVLGLRAVNSGTNTVLADLLAAAGGAFLLPLLSVGSGVATAGAISIGSVTTASATTTAVPVGLGYPFIVSGTQCLRIRQSGAGAQNDTFQVLVNIRCKSALPTVSHANSTNPANVSVTAGAESFATV